MIESTFFKRFTKIESTEQIKENIKLTFSFKIPLIWILSKNTFSNDFINTWIFD